MNYKNLLLILFQFLSNSVSCSPLHNVLIYYEILKHGDPEHRVVKRSLDEPNHIRRVKFRFDGKEHELDLRQSQNMLAFDFKAISIDANGKTKEIIINKYNHYKGTLEGEEDSVVIAHIENNVINAEIISKNDTIFIEPAKLHFPDNDTSANDMIAYRLSDVKWNFTKSGNNMGLHPRNCAVHVDVETNFTQSEQHRNRRSTDGVAMSNNVCELKLVADYEYFINVGSGDRAKTVNYMVHVISRVDDIYRRTSFNSVGKNVGFVIKEVMVHEDHTNLEEYSYNKKHNGPWNVDQLLTAFSRTDWSTFCLAHLFTYQDFANGIIGLAYVASPRLHNVGGICTQSYQDVIGQRYLNCGLSSAKNWGRRLLTAEADLVTAHEIGHNFGSNHDPSSSLCQPSDDNGGKYIMYAHSVSGEQYHNTEFSPCSIEAIGKVLQTKKHLCFTTPKNSGEFCGNNIVEGDEECDAGLLSKEDKCCTANCELRVVNSKKNECSDSNDQCCTECKYASKDKVCRLESIFHCTGQTNCTGTGKSCPAATKLNNNETCGFTKGNCQSGKCVSLCTQKKMISCTCSAGPNSCKICCADSARSSCNVLNPNINEDDGAPCFLDSEHGQCISGECKKNKQNVEDEFKSLLQDFTLDKFVRLMKANIVGTILFFSLLIWVPASVAVYYIDKKDHEESQFMQNWMHPKSRHLLHKGGGKLGHLFKRNPSKKKVRTQYHISS